MALTTCPDCEARVSRTAEVCVRCGRPLRPRETSAETPAAPVGMRRGIKLLVLGWGFLLMATALFLTSVPETDARKARRKAGALKALVGLRDVRMAQHGHYLRTGRYVSRPDLFQGQPSTPDEWGTRYYLDLETSRDGQAYLAVHRWWEYGAECAEVVRNGPETAASRALHTGSWKELAANAPARCRKLGAPWQWLHWAGIGYLDVREVRGGE